LGLKSTDYKRSFNERKYERLSITIPKGQKAAVQAAADKESESINGFVNKAILSRMGLEEWTNKSD
jgi:uncharacterized protein (DUF1778 family)